MLTEFNLDRLPGFGWSQEQEKLEQLQSCADSNVTDCEIGEARSLDAVALPLSLPVSGEQVSLAKGGHGRNG